VILILLTMFMVLSSWHSHCESSPGSFDECRLSAGWPPTLRPNQPIWAVSPPKDRHWMQQTKKSGWIFLRLLQRFNPGASTQWGEWCEMHHGENWGDFVMIMMLLLVSIIIYYYMNTFITLHQCTFNLLFALFSILIYQLSLHAKSA